MTENNPTDPVPAGIATYDPRVRPEYVREVTDARGHPVVLVGTVHGHPASVYRARTIADAVRPDVVALELSPSALPAFRAAARQSEPNDEMTAAIQGAPTARHVGIDAVDPGFLASLARCLYADRAEPATVRSVGRGVRRVLRRSMSLRLLALGAGPVELPPGPQYDCTPMDSPETQARTERTHVGRCAALLAATAPPPAQRVVNGVREERMARRLAALREEGSVVAVVGWGHLDAVATRLEAIA